MFKFLRKKGFTLAEILLTMAIIGTVAALVIPNVNVNFQKKIYVSKLQVTYNEINKAIEEMIQREGVENFNETSAMRATTSYKGKNFLLNNFDVLNANCAQEGKICLGQDKKAKVVEYKNLKGAKIRFTDLNRFYCIQTKKEAAICMWGEKIFIDVNGDKLPNVAGRDLFYFTVENGTSFDAYDSRPYSANRISDPKSSAMCGKVTGKVYEQASGCFNKIIESDWVMKY